MWVLKNYTHLVSFASNQTLLIWLSGGDSFWSNFVHGMTILLFASISNFKCPYLLPGRSQGLGLFVVVKGDRHHGLFDPRRLARTKIRRTGHWGFWWLGHKSRGEEKQFFGVVCSTVYGERKHKNTTIGFCAIQWNGTLTIRFLESFPQKKKKKRKQDKKTPGFEKLVCIALWKFFGIKYFSFRRFVRHFEITTFELCWCNYSATTS